MKRPSRIVALGGSLAAVGASGMFAACQLAFPTVLSSEGPPDSAAPPDDARADAPVSDVGAPDTAPACGKSVPPFPSTSASFGSQEILVAVKSVYYGEDAGPIPDLGYDLDCVDTCPGPSSCVPRGNTMQKACDLSDARDLAANLFIQAIENFQTSTAQDTLNSLFTTGGAGFLIWLTKYNGQPDDSEVLLSTIASTGIRGDAGARIAPKWDGTDVWNVDPASVTGMYRDGDGGYLYLPAIVSTQAYVTNNTLVARLDGIPLQLGVGTITLSHAYVVAAITPMPEIGGYRLDGQLVGRIATSNVLAILATIKDPLDSTQYLCGDDPTFQSFVTSFCDSADIMFDPTLDNKGAECDGFSAALGFVAISAYLGAEYPKGPTVTGCDGSVQVCP